MPCLEDEDIGYVCMTPVPGEAEARGEIEQVGSLGGGGGVIVMNRNGTPAFAMNTSGMYRGAVSSGEPAAVAIYGDEELRP